MSQQNHPTVSVLTTVYNRAAYLRECIESVLASSFEDFEYIIVDDASSDLSYDIAFEYAKRDSRVRVYRNETNLGDYPNRNRAAAYAKGAFLKYVDSDDIIYPHGLGLMAESMQRFPDAGLGLCRAPDAKLPYPVQLDPRSAYIEHYFLEGGLLNNAPLSAIIRRDIFEQIGGFNAMQYVGDFDMWLRLGARAPVVKMTAGLTWWRRHGDQEYFEGARSFAYLELNYVIAVRALNSRLCPLSPTERERAAVRLKAAQMKALVRLATVRRKPRRAWNIWHAGRAEERRWRKGKARIGAQEIEDGR
jgi:glycosyltransferase involved in cell wall biosynthesis